MRKEMAKESKIVLDQKLVDLLAMIVDRMDRDKDPEGKTYNGLNPKDVAGAFYAILRQIKHSLADMKNEGCNSDTPCGACRTCVLAAHSKAAQEQGKLLWIPKVKTFRDGRNVVTKTYGRYYRSGEIGGGKSYEDFAKALING